MRREPKILIFDIETAPLLGNVWSLWKQNIGLNQLQKDWYVMSWAAKWYGEDNVMYMDVRNTPEYDKNILVPLKRLLDDADWVITHNGNKFDIPKLRSRMLLNRIPPFSPVQSIDTCYHAKRLFGFTSNKLEYLSEVLAPDYVKSKHKEFPGFELWDECVKGNPKAWDEMEKYNIQDVLALEAVYNAMLPWLSTHPNHGLFAEEGSKPTCPRCGGTVHRRGLRHTAVGVYQRFHCPSCNSWSSSRAMEKIDRSHVLKPY